MPDVRAPRFVQEAHRQSRAVAAGPAGSATGGVTVSGRITSKSNVVSVPLRCAATSGSCAPATVRLTVVEDLRHGHVVAVSARRKSKTSERTVLVGGATVTLAAGQSETVRISLNATGKKLLAHHSQLPVRVVITSHAHAS